LQACDARIVLRGGREYERDLGYVRQVLRDGNERANEIAAATLAEVSSAMGMDY
jgi:tryptophanyl-tRNA synthetase